MNKDNYRQTCGLPALSKIFEGILVDQMGDAIENIYSTDLLGSRKHHSSQNVILNLIENSKFTLDNDMYGAVLSDLSKAFNCLPYQLYINLMLMVLITMCVS